MLTRRQTLLAATATTLVGIAGSGPVHAADKVIKIGVDLSLTGADSRVQAASRTPSSWRSTRRMKELLCPATSSTCW